MALKILLIGGDGGSHSASVTKNGELVTAPLEYDQSVYKEWGTAASGYTHFAPKTGEQFVITGFYLKADKQVSSSTDADVLLYEADEEDSATVSKILFETAMVQDETVTMTGIRLLVGKGKYVNGKTSDDDVHATVMGYYIPAVP